MMMQTALKCTLQFCPKDILRVFTRVTKNKGMCMVKKCQKMQSNL
jgi:hypothetical protein